MTDPVEQAEAEVLDGLGERFLDALRRKDAGAIEDAEDALLDILRVEPRLPEPHLELARIYLDTDRISDAEPHAREALRHLQAGGQWIEDIPADTLLALANAVLAEVLRRRADEDDVIFGDPQTFRDLVDEAKAHFQRAQQLDPSDEYSSYHAFFLGAPAGVRAILPGDDPPATDDDPPAGA